MAYWLDLSNNANCFESMYVKGFVDISGGSLQLRNSDNHLLVGGDASFNGGIYLGGAKLVTTDVVESITFTGSPSYQIGQDIDGEATNDQSGYSVSINGDGTIVAIGAFQNDGTTTSNAGHVRIYQYNGTVWNQLGQDIDGEAAGDESGYSVSINNDGTIIAIGARYNDGNGNNAGHTRIYQYNGTVWNQLGQDIDGEAANDYSGYSVSINGDGTIVAIGAVYNDGTQTNSDAGHVRVYQYNGTVWNQLGQDIDGEATTDQLGYSVSLNGNGTVVAIGARNNDGTSTDINYTIGHTRIYQYNGTVWNKIGQDIDGEAQDDFAGSSVSLNSDGTIVAIGAIWNHGNGSYSGHVRIYQYNGTVWNQLGQDIDGEASGDQSGYSVSINGDGTIVAIGAPDNDGTSTSNMGHVRIYQYNGTVWNKLGQDIDGEAKDDRYGYYVSLSSDGTRVAIGANDNDGTGVSNMGHVRVYELAHTKSYVQVPKQVPLQIGTETQRPGYAADISGIVDISGALFTQGDVSMNGNLYVSGDATIGGALTFGSASIAASNVSFSSDISMNNRLFVNVSDVNYSNISGYLTTKTLSGGPSYQIGQDIDGEASGDSSGTSVSINSDGTIIAIGAVVNDGTSTNTNYGIGHVRIYQYNGTVWNQLGQDIDGEAGADYSGNFVSISSDGTIVAIGAYWNDGTGASQAGHVRIYQYNGTVWNQLGQDIDGEAANEYSGYSVSINSDGTIVAIGAHMNDGTSTDSYWNSGHVRVYQYNSSGNIWNQLGQDIDGEAQYDFAGRSVSINSDGTIVAIGANGNDGNGSNSGHVRIYQYNGTVWNQLGQDIDGEGISDESGHSVSINSDGTIVAIGAFVNYGTGYGYMGHVRVYQYNSSGNIWNQLGQDIDGEANGGKSGYSVSLSSDGTIVAIGAIWNQGTGVSNMGHTRIYQYNGTVWNKLGQDIDGEAQDDQSGWSVSLNSDGTRVAIGAYNNDGTSTDTNHNTGHVRVYELAHTTTTTPIYQKIHSDVNSSGSFSTDISLNNSLIVPSNITIVDSSSNNYGSYTVYTDKAATNFFSVGKSASHVFNIVNHDNAGVYMASGSTSLTSTSDARLKTAIEPIEDATDKLMQLNPCTYKWKTQDEADPKKHVGFIAQEVEALFPNLVNENTYPDGSTYKGVATTDLIPYLLKTCISMNEQLTKIKEYIKSKKST
jgi:hypothetical protein